MRSAPGALRLIRANVEIRKVPAIESASARAAGLVGSGRAFVDMALDQHADRAGAVGVCQSLGGQAWQRRTRHRRHALR
jgi:hypothetical protein